MRDKTPDKYDTNEAKTFEGEACETGANEPQNPTLHMVVSGDGKNYVSLPPTDQRPDH